MGFLPLSDGRMLRPISLAERAGAVAGKLPGAAAVAQNVIFVCRKAATAIER